MAVDLETGTFTKRESIARIELFTDAVLQPAEWTLRYHFETASYDSNGVIDPDTVKFGSRVVERKFGDIAADVIDDGAGHTASVAQISAWIKAAGYKYRQDDINAGK